MPNLLMIVTDQHRYDGVSANGSQLCQTPALDGLASGGMRFEHAFTCIGLCSPARASLLTGLYPHNHGALNNNGTDGVRYELEPECWTFTQALGEAGWQLGYVGKWHVNRTHTPTDYGFHDYVPIGPYRRYREGLGYEWNEAFGSYFRPTGVTDDIPVEASRPYFLAEQAIALIRKYAADQQSRPWHVRLDFHGPHLPNVIPEPYASMYDPKSFQPWGNFGDTFEGKPSAHYNQLRNWAIEDMTWEDWQPIVAKYYGEVSLLDWCIGRVLQCLDDLGSAEDTVVVFTTDHGDANGSHRMYDKGYCMYEELYRVPLIIRWPGVTQPGSVSRAFVNDWLDLVPTALDIAGLPAPERLDGRSLVPVLSGEAPADWPDMAYAEFHGMQFGLYTQRMVRTERYKLVYNGSDVDELYDLERDPHELHNRIDDPDYRQVREEHWERFMACIAGTDDHLPPPWLNLG
ncbi:MAG: sulfatase-like hydrolase/transferase [Armatimonadota bacterium]